MIEKVANTNGEIYKIELNGKAHKSYFISHDELVNGSVLKMILK